MVPGKGPNKDTVPAMLAPGEFVMSKELTEAGAGMLSMNAAAGFISDQMDKVVSHTLNLVVFKVIPRKRDLI